MTMILSLRLLNENQLIIGFGQAYLCFTLPDPDLISLRFSVPEKKNSISIPVIEEVP
jgi:hypothetical protein